MIVYLRKEKTGYFKTILINLIQMEFDKIMFIGQQDLTILDEILLLSSLFLCSVEGEFIRVGWCHKLLSQSSLSP